MAKPVGQLLDFPFLCTSAHTVYWMILRIIFFSQFEKFSDAKVWPFKKLVKLRNVKNRMFTGGGPGGHRPSQQPYVNRPGGSGRFSTIQNRSPQQQAQFHQQMQMQQQQRLRTPNNYNNGPIMTNGQSGSGSR
jgi:hypothetical protein